MRDAPLTLQKKIVWLLLAPAVVGALTGVCVAGLAAGVEQLGNGYLASLPGYWPAIFGPVGLLLTILVTRYVTRVDTPSTSELYITLYHQQGSRVPLEQTPGRALAAATTVGLGGSQGFESTSALVGASWSELASRIPAIAPPADVRKSWMAAGASAGIAAVFSSPGAGALYGMELPYKNDVDAPRLVPCAISAVVSFAVRTWLIGEQRIVNVDVNDLPALDTRFFFGCLLVAVCCGVGARLFAVVEETLQSLGRRQTRLRRALVGGGSLALLAVGGYALCDRWITFGSGYIATGWAQAEPRTVEILAVALLIRAGGNLATVYGGGGGGVYTSLACNGALVGEGVARLLGCDRAHVLAAFGAACFLAAGYRLPLACMLFVAEAGIGAGLTAAGLGAVAIAMALMGDHSVSESQIDRRSP